MNEDELLRAAHAAGRDAGTNGASLANCNFGLFSTPAATKEWERGKREAEAEKARP